MDQGQIVVAETGNQGKYMVTYQCNEVHWKASGRGDTFLGPRTRQTSKYAAINVFSGFLRLNVFLRLLTAHLGYFRRVMEQK